MRKKKHNPQVETILADFEDFRKQVEEMAEIFFSSTDATGRLLATRLYLEGWTRPQIQGAFSTQVSVLDADLRKNPENAGALELARQTLLIAMDVCTKPEDMLALIEESQQNTMEYDA